MSEEKTNGKAKPAEKETCGIIMPISGGNGYTSDHWSDVRLILEEVINSADFIPNLVSDADDVGIIHNRIVNNVYNNPILICDVSSKNPNVMFELGLRLAFDKATIIIKDTDTDYNFDTGLIEHLTYPKDLRYATINKFKDKLLEKLKATHNSSKQSGYSTFLKHFVQYKPKLDVEEVNADKYMLRKLEEIAKELSNIRFQNRQSENEYEVRKGQANPEFIQGMIDGHLNRFLLENKSTKEDFSVSAFLDFLKEKKINVNSEIILRAIDHAISF